MKQYPGLRIISVIYKALMLLTVITTLGALGYISAQAVGNKAFVDWLSPALGLTIGGSLLALTFYVVAQLVDIQIEQASSLRAIEAKLAQMPSVEGEVKTLNKNVDALRSELKDGIQQVMMASRSSRLQTTPPPHSAPTKTIGGSQNQP